MKTILLILILFSFHSQISVACIFQSENASGKSPFWPSRTIPVCFLPPNPATHISAPNPLDEEYRNKFNENIATIKRTLQSQINGRTIFQMSGFEICPTPDSGHKIRFDLNQAGGGEGAMAASIGAGASQESPNVLITTVNSESRNGVKPQKSTSPRPINEAADRIRKFHSAEHISWVALHETMHMLGLHHTEVWDMPLTEGDNDVAALIQVGQGPDSSSIMNRGVRNMLEGIAQLSPRDVSCLNLIANKTILSLPSRSASQAPEAPASRELFAPTSPNK